MRRKHRGPHNLVDHSQVLNKRAKRRNAESPNKSPAEHGWIALAVGRVCSRCEVAQATNEFDDTVPCEPRFAS